MPEKLNPEVIKQCLKIDTLAQKAYQHLADSFQAEPLKSFWQEMAEEENLHIDFWNRLATEGEKGVLPEVFENPQQTLSELSNIVPKVEKQLSRYKSTGNASDAFLLAYRLEFYMLHPAFETLFYCLRTAAGAPNPEDQYEAHITRFINMLDRHGKVSPELDLLGETLKRLWKQNQNLAYQASRDSLSGLLNRRGFHVQMIQMASLAQRNGFTACLMLLDIDYFKGINDQYGHETGDRILRFVGDVLKTGLRRSDLVGRYGGEDMGRRHL